VTDPDGTIEPLEGVKRRVALSKDLVATTTEDLKQYHHWLKDYLASATYRAQTDRWCRACDRNPETK